MTIENYPNCIICGRPMLHETGEAVSLEAYISLLCLCNECLFDQHDMTWLEEVTHENT